MGWFSSTDTDTDTDASTFAFTDAHCHFWDPSRLPCPWLVDVPQIAGRHTPAELEAEAGALMPRQLVFVQAGSEPPWEEVRWVEELAAAEPRLGAIVAFTPVDRGEETMSALAKLGRRPLVRGIRHLLQDQADPGFCLRPEFVAGVRRVGELGLSFDLCIRSHQLPPVTALVQACPGTSFILDHLAKPAIRSGALVAWRDDIARLADLSNVTCKLSGMVTEADPAAWTPSDLRPYLEHVVSVFGPERLMFGSDWPVVKIGSSYAGWVQTARKLLADYSPRAQAAIFQQTAGRVYRLETEEHS